MKYLLNKKEVIYEFGSMVKFAAAVGCRKQNIHYHLTNNISQNNKILKYCQDHKKMYLLIEQKNKDL